MGTVTHLDAWKQAKNGDATGNGVPASRGEVNSSLQAEDRDPRSSASEDDAVQRCYRQAIRFLASSDKTKSELRRLLAQREYAPPVIDEALSRVVAEGLCNDEAYAARFVEKAALQQRQGARALEQALVARGISRQTIEIVLAERPLDDAATAQLVAEHYAATHRSLPDDVLRRRLTGLMQRRGFASGDARAAIEAQLSQNGLSD